MDIVIAFADTEIGREALEHGLDEARRRSARVHVLHAVRIGIRNEVPDVIGRYQSRMREIGDHLEQEGLDGRSELLMVNEEPATAILQQVTDLGAELLVVGSRSRSLVGKLVLGSMAQQLLLGSPCPVLVVRRPPQ